LASSNAYGWTVSSPIAASDSSVFNGSLGAYFYNPLTAAWKLNDSTKLKTMLGYWTKFSNNKTLEFNHGVLNTGELPYTNFYRTGYLSGNFGWNFMGNPYPSAIDWDLVVGLDTNGGAYNKFKDSTLLNSPIHISNNDGGYNSYNNGIGTGGFDGIIPPATAFWIQVNKDYIHATDPIAGARLIFDNSVRLHPSGSKKSTPADILRLSISDNNLSDEAIVRLHSEASMDFDPAYDAQKMLAENENMPQLYTLISEGMLSINSIPGDLSSPVILPVGVITPASAAYKFTADVTSLNGGVNVYLEDRASNSLTDLRQQPVYSFQPAGTEDNDRFTLHLTTANTAINSNISESTTSVYTYDGSMYINLQEENAVLKVFNLFGQEVYNKQISNGLTKHNLNLATGNYIVNVISEYKVKTEKVLLR